MYYDLCNGTIVGPTFEPCYDLNSTQIIIEDGWPMEKWVAVIVPIAFGLITIIGLIGNVLVVVGE